MQLDELKATMKDSGLPNAFRTQGGNLDPLQTVDNVTCQWYECTACTLCTNCVTGCTKVIDTIGSNS